MLPIADSTISKSGNEHDAQQCYTEMAPKLLTIESLLRNPSRAGIRESCARNLGLASTKAALFSKLDDCGRVEEYPVKKNLQPFLNR
jgi:hypothetical protein